MKAHHVYEQQWDVGLKMRKLFFKGIGADGSMEDLNMDWHICSKRFSRVEDEIHPIISSMVIHKNIDLEGQFKYVVPKSIYGYWNRLLCPVFKI